MIKKYISLKVAAISIIALLGLLLIFHIAILTGLAPDNMVWGSRLQTPEQRLIMESIALFFTALMLSMVLIRMGYVKAGEKITDFSRTAMWVIFLFFLLNFAGNLSSPNIIEKAVFGPVALLLALFAYRLAMR